MRERIIIFELIKKIQTLEFRDSCTITNNEINIQASFEYISQNTVTVPINNSVRMKLIVSFHIDQYLNITSKIEDIQLQPEVGKSMVLSKYVWGALGFEHDIMPRYENIPHLHMQSKYPQNSFQTPQVNNTQVDLLTGIPEIGGDINSNIGGIAANGGDVTSGDYLFNKTYAHFQVGGQDPMNIDASTVNMGNITQKDLTYNPKTGSYSLDLYKTNPVSQASLALGKISLNNEGRNQFSINPDYYDFNIEWQNGFSKRNIATFGAGVGHYNATSLIFGGPFWINFQGTTTIKP